MAELGEGRRVRHLPGRYVDADEAPRGPRVRDGVLARLVGEAGPDPREARGQYIIPEGMAYNSYVILDDKIAVMDPVDEKFGKEWLSNIEKVVGDREPDYLVVHHMEPDHSANIPCFMEAYPGAKIVAGKKAFKMMEQFFGTDYADRKIEVAEGDKIELGIHELNFVAAPMVHWPEVIMSYDSTDKVLFSADAFGKFGALDIEDDDWACEARRYYFNIVGKFGAQVQNVLKKVAGFEINVICPLHGPVLSENLDYYLNIYDTWSSYTPEDEGVFIAYTSVYGHTKEAVELLEEKLKAAGVEIVESTDLAREDMAEAIEDAFRYDRLVLATTTYNADMFPFMKTFLEELKERGYKNRKIAMIENGSWAPTAAKFMKAMLEGSKDITLVEPIVTVKGALNDESRARVEALAKELAK